MKRQFLAGMAAAAAVTACLLTASGAAAAPDVASAGALGGTSNANLPVDIRVDETQYKVVASFVGIGKQVYDCDSTGKFVFREPVAGLLSRGVQAAIHGKGPFWASFDGSHVDGSGAVSPPASPAYTDLTKNVPWLRLVGSQPTTPNPTTGVFSNVKFIQRLDTRGGVAPATCAAPKTVAVDYTANYVFWAQK